jgi:hypothetical protein
VTRPSNAGGRNRVRTCDLFLVREALSQLSYSPILDRLYLGIRRLSIDTVGIPAILNMADWSMVARTVCEVAHVARTTGKREYSVSLSISCAWYWGRNWMAGGVAVNEGRVHVQSA